MIIDYDHFSTVAFGNTWITLWRKNVLCLEITYLIVVANLGVILVSILVLWSYL